MRKPNLIVMSLVLVIAIGGAWQANSARHKRQQELAAATQQRAKLAEKMHDEEKRIASAEQERAELQAALDGLLAAARSSAAKKTTPPPTRPSMDELLAKNPELQTLYLAYRRAELATRYGPLLQTLHLTPEQIAKFEELVMKRSEQRLDLESAKQTLPVADNNRAAATLSRQSDEEFKEAQIAVLGTDGYRQLLEYERCMQMHSQIVDTLGGSLAFTETPLTAQQAELLTQTLARASSSYQKGGTARSDTVDWDAVLAQAPSLLSAAQFEVLKATAIQEQISAKMWKILRDEKLMP